MLNPNISKINVTEFLFKTRGELKLTIEFKTIFYFVEPRATTSTVLFRRGKKLFSRAKSTLITTREPIQTETDQLTMITVS